LNRCGHDDGTEGERETVGKEDSKKTHDHGPFQTIGFVMTRKKEKKKIRGVRRKN